MLLINIRKFLFIFLAFLIYLILAGLTAKYPELKKPLLIIFGLNSLVGVLMYISLKWYNRKKNKLIIRPEEANYLANKYRSKLTQDMISNYLNQLSVLICLSIVLAGLPLVIAGGI